jgi:nucleotide-binding universal stress UspA family protein
LTAINSKFSKIMVAIDGSEHSLRAAEYALEVAKSFGAQLYAVTVTYAHESYPIKQRVESEEKSDGASNDNAKAWFGKFILDAKEKNIQLKTELIKGYRSWPLIPVPAEYILVEYAEKENIDLIVVGTRGTSGLKRLLIGSVASGVVKHAHCTVLVVR